MEPATLPSCLRSQACGPLMAYLRVDGLGRLMQCSRSVNSAVTGLQRLLCLCYSPGKVLTSSRSLLWAEALRPPIGIRPPPHTHTSTHTHTRICGGSFRWIFLSLGSGVAFSRAAEGLVVVQILETHSPFHASPVNVPRHTSSRASNNVYVVSPVDFSSVEGRKC